MTIFRSRLREDAGSAYGQTAERMLAAAQRMPGFLGIKTFHAEDGERVSIVTFATRVQHDAWRDHPGHRRAQEMGRELFYSEYRIQVCRVLEDRAFP